MPRVDIMMELGQDYLIDDDRKPKSPSHKTHDKQIRVKGDFFNKALKEGLIEKTDDGYVFVGKYEDVKKLKKKNY